MTIAEAITKVDQLKPNHHDEQTKIGWLSKLDGQIYREVFATHADNPLTAFDGYENAEQSTELLVPYPYDEDIYVYYLQAMIDKENGEINKYNQSITMYNTVYSNFGNWYHRTHKPLSSGARFLF